MSIGLFIVQREQQVPSIHRQIFQKRIPGAPSSRQGKHWFISKSVELVFPKWFIPLLLLDNALHEIRHMQKSVALLIPQAPFNRLIREIAQGHKDDLRMQSITLAVLQEAAETMIVMWFEMLYLSGTGPRAAKRELIMSE